MKTLIFDCDGVLVDSESVLIDEELAFLCGFGVQLERSDYIRRFSGTALTHWEAAIGDLIAAAGSRRPEEREFRALEAATDHKLKESLAAVAGVRSFLQATAGPRCVASSSTPTQLQWKLSITELNQFFHPHVFSTTAVTNGKPAPDLFLYAAKQLGATPSNCVVIEDSANGIRAAKAAGMLAVGLTAADHCAIEHHELLTASGADFVAGDYQQLAAYLGL